MRLWFRRRRELRFLLFPKERDIFGEFRVLIAAWFIRFENARFGGASVDVEKSAAMLLRLLWLFSLFDFARLNA